MNIILVSKPGDSHLMKSGKIITSTINCYRLVCGNRQAFNLLKLIAYDFAELAMPRKRAIANSIIRYYESSSFKKRRNIYDHKGKSLT